MLPRKNATVLNRFTGKLTRDLESLHMLLSESKEESPELSTCNLISNLEDAWMSASLSDCSDPSDGMSSDEEEPPLKRPTIVRRTGIISNSGPWKSQEDKENAMISLQSEIESNPELQMRISPKSISDSGCSIGRPLENTGICASLFDENGKRKSTYFMDVPGLESPESATSLEARLYMSPLIIQGSGLMDTEDMKLSFLMTSTPVEETWDYFYDSLTGIHLPWPLREDLWNGFQDAFSLLRTSHWNVGLPLDRNCNWVLYEDGSLKYLTWEKASDLLTKARQQMSHMMDIIGTEPDIAA